MEEDRPRLKPGFTPGAPLDAMSVEEIDAAIALLEGEIERLRAGRAAKRAHLEAAGALFRRPAGD